MSQNNDGYLPIPKGFATKAIHTAQNPENWDTHAIYPPLVSSSTYKLHNLGVETKYEYGRLSNPNRNILEECLAVLENGKHCLCYSSGIGSIMALLVSMLESGDEILSTKDLYGGTHKVFSQIVRPLGIKVDFVDVSDVSHIESRITARTKLMWLESPTNPLLRVFDIRAIAQVAKRNGVLLVVDNTFLTPYFQRPLELGADIVVHSLTKYLNGHSDVIMGAVVLNDEQVHAKLRDLQGATGIIPSPFDCSQVVRSLKTLEIRMKKHSENALAVAKFLESHPKVERVMHPGLPSHPDHELSKRQTSGHSGMITFFVKGGYDNVKKILDNLKLFTLAESLGGYDSLVAYPPLMTHIMVPKKEQLKMNITDNILRLSIGLESEEDLIDDLAKALAAV